VALALLMLVTTVIPVQSIAEDQTSFEGGGQSRPVEELRAGQILDQFARIGYSGDEWLRYDVYYSGGVKLGELRLALRDAGDQREGYEIDANVTTKNGAVHYIYPVYDRYLTKVHRESKLPYHYEIWQKEGYNYESHKILEYDQQNFKVAYLKNGEISKVVQLEGWFNNEFSSFFNSRLMVLEPGKPFIVPTYADRRRVEVVVHPMAREILTDTIFGDVPTISIMPVLTFKGLYDKQGDTVIWYSDDECRIPMQVNSKIVLGSLTAKLKEYSNPACTLYPETGIEKQ
jgi:hypothetical protein